MTRMSTEALQTELNMGLVAWVRFADGSKTEAWPLDWLEVTPDSIAFWAVGGAERLHTWKTTRQLHDPAEATIQAETDNGLELTIEPNFTPTHEAALSIWKRLLAGKNPDVQRNYPDGGLRLAN